MKIKAFCKIIIPAMLIVLTLFAAMKIPDHSTKNLMPKHLFGKKMSHETYSYLLPGDL